MSIDDYIPKVNGKVKKIVEQPATESKKGHRTTGKLPAEIQVRPPGVATTTAKRPRQVVDNRRNSAISPKHTSEVGQQNFKTLRSEREKIKNTPQREGKKKVVAVPKNVAANHNNLANSRCRSKLSIGSSQTHGTQ